MTNPVYLVNKHLVLSLDTQMPPSTHTHTSVSLKFPPTFPLSGPSGNFTSVVTINASYDVAYAEPRVDRYPSYLAILFIELFRTTNVYTIQVCHESFSPPCVAYAQVSICQLILLSTLFPKTSRPRLRSVHDSQRFLEGLRKP